MVQRLPGKGVRPVLRKLEKLLAVLPVLAMAAASVSFIRSLFYNFHNDTVPLISIGISCVFALLNLAFLILSALCIFVFVRQKKPSLRRRRKYRFWWWRRCR